jgi:hypothetical protein
VCLCITHTLLPGKGSRVAHAVRVHAAREHCPPTHTALSIIIVPFCVCTVCITGRYTVYRQPPLEYTHCVHLCTHGVSHREGYIRRHLKANPPMFNPLT